MAVAGTRTPTRASATARRIRRTPRNASRLNLALPYDSKTREPLEEKIANGQLEICVDRKPRELDEHLTELRTQPCHILAVFDEAPTTVREGRAGEALPMSPFCVRRRGEHEP